MSINRILIIISVLSLSQAAFANWTLNLGYNNPPGATVGGNFMYQWTNWAFEAGVGGVEQSKGTDSSGKETKAVSVLGAINLKYLFNSGTIRPYLQGGAGSSVSVQTQSSTSVSAGVGGAYFGGGIFIIGRPIYVYISYNVGGSSGFLQFGLGFDI